MGTAQSTRTVNYTNDIDAAKGKVNDFNLDCHLAIYNIYRTGWYTATNLEGEIFSRCFFVSQYETRFVAFKGCTIWNEGDSCPINEVFYHADGVKVEDVGKGKGQGHVWKFETLVQDFSPADEARIWQALEDVVNSYEKK
jgi:hypothetical protein